MKRKIFVTALIVCLVFALSISAFAADYGYTRYLGSGNSGYLRYCDQTSISNSSTSWYVYYPRNTLTVKISSNGGGGTVYVNTATSSGNYLSTGTINGTGSTSFSRTAGTVVQFDNMGGAGTLRGTVTTS